MSKGFKKIFIVIMLVCGFLYVVENKGLQLKDINLKEIKLYLSEEDKLANQNNINESTELILVNRDYGLERDYKPENLYIPDIQFVAGVSREEKHVAGIIVKQLEELVSTAKKEGILLLGNSGYRSYETQENTYNNRVRSSGKKLADSYVAKPGFSEHQTGLCIDITNQSRNFTKGTKEADWLAENCYKFGFIIRYPYGKESITGIKYEPWHIRYVGKKAAKYIHDNGITLEEYLAKYVNS